MTINGSTTFDTNEGGSVDLLDSRRLVLNGDATVLRYEGYPRADAEVRFGGTAAMEVTENGTLTLEGNVELMPERTGGALLTSRGAIIKRDSGNAVVGVPYEGPGTVTVVQGELSLRSNGSPIIADYDVQPTARLSLADFAFAAGSSLTVQSHAILGIGNSHLAEGATIAGDGAFHVIGGTSEINGAVSVAGELAVRSGTANFNAAASLLSFGPTLRIEGGAANFSSGRDFTFDTYSQIGGTLLGSDDLLINGTATINSAARLAGSGVLRLRGTTTLDVNNQATMRISESRRIIFGGEATAIKTHPYDYIGATISVGDTASLEVEAGATLTLAGGIDFWQSHTYRQASLVNNGTVIKTGASGSSSDLLYFGAGNVVVEEGYLILDGGGSAEGDILVEKIGTLALGRTFQLAGESSIVGPGIVEFRMGTINVNGTYNITGATRILGESVTFNPASTLVSLGPSLSVNRGEVNLSSGEAVNVETYTHARGALTGSDSVTVAGAADVGLGVEISGSGTLTLNGPTKLSAIKLGDTRRLVLNADATLTTAASNGWEAAVATLEVGPAATLVVGDGVDLVAGAGPTPWLVNRGSMVKVGGRPSRIETDFTSHGELRLVEEADVTVAPPNGTFIIGGLIDLSAGSEFAVEGNAQVATGQPVVIATDIRSSSRWGAVAITGTSELDASDSASRLDVDLLGGYAPPLGERFDIVTAAGGISGSLESFSGGTTPSSNRLIVVRPDAQTLAVEVDDASLPSPQVVSQAFEFERHQAVALTFNTDVDAFLSRSDFRLLDLSTGEEIAATVGTFSYDPNSYRAELLLTTQLADGDYRVVLPAATVANAAGDQLAEDFVLDFFVLAGDTDRDRDVDFFDFLKLRSNYGTSGKLFSDGDFDYDGERFQSWSCCAYRQRCPVRGLRR